MILPISNVFNQKLIHLHCIWNQYCTMLNITIWTFCLCNDQSKLENTLNNNSEGDSPCVSFPPDKLIEAMLLRARFTHACPGLEAVLLQQLSCIVVVSDIPAWSIHISWAKIGLSVNDVRVFWLFTTLQRKTNIKGKYMWSKRCDEMIQIPPTTLCQLHAKC